MDVGNGYNNTDYHRPEKDERRYQVFNFYKRYMKKDDYHPLITLETAQWLFVNLFKKKTRFTCYQINKDEYNNQLENKPDNVELIFNNCNKIDFPIKYAYFDYCNSWYSNVEFIRKLFFQKMILNNSIIGFTVCKRTGGKKIISPFPLEKRINLTLKSWARQNGYEFINFIPLPYQDKNHTAMITYILYIKKVK